MNPFDRVRSWFLRFVGYLVPLVQSVPSIGVYAGLMTVPFATYLILFFVSLPDSFISVLEFFFWPRPFFVLERVFIVIGLFLLVYSLVYLRIKRKEGLVTSGPYRLVRHPQYLGMILSTLGFTGFSVWILYNTYGIGFLSPSQTIGMWFIELLAYILLAHIEELFLSRSYGETFEKYKSQVPFLIPFFKINRKVLDVLVSILIPAILLFILINVQI